MRLTKATDANLYAELRASMGFQNMGLASSRVPGTMTFLDSEKFLGDICSNKHIVGVITNSVYAQALAERRPDIKLHTSVDPRQTFYETYNARAEQNNRLLKPSRIHATALIHERAYVAPYGVIIEAHVIIEPMVTVMPGVRIGSHTQIRAGSAIGVEGFEHKRVGGHLLTVIHDRYVVIGEDVEIGANNTIARGLMGEDTEIGSGTKTDCLVHIAHCAKIGKRCLIPASAMIAGSVTIGDDVWIGPNASISSQVSIGDGAFVTIGSVVVKDVAAKSHVSGNFAIDHMSFLRILRNATHAIKR